MVKRPRTQPEPLETSAPVIEEPQQPVAAPIAFAPRVHPVILAPRVVPAARPIFPARALPVPAFIGPRPRPVQAAVNPNFTPGVTSVRFSAPGINYEY